MKIVTIIVRVLLGLALTASGLTFFFGMMPKEAMPGAGGEFVSAMMSTGVFGFVKFCEVAAGLMLLSGFQVPLALLIWFPINIVVVLFHTMMAPFNPAVFVFLLLTLFLAWVYKNNFAPIFNVGNAWVAQK